MLSPLPSIFETALIADEIKPSPPLPPDRDRVDFARELDLPLDDFDREPELLFDDDDFDFDDPVVRFLELDEPELFFDAEPLLLVERPDDELLRDEPPDDELLRADDPPDELLRDPEDDVDFPLLADDPDFELPDREELDFEEPDFELDLDEPDFELDLDEPDFELDLEDPDRDELDFDAEDLDLDPDEDEDFFEPEPEELDFLLEAFFVCAILFPPFIYSDTPSAYRCVLQSRYHWSNTVFGNVADCTSF